MNGTDIPRSLCSHVHVGMSIWAREDNECICEQFCQWRVLAKSVFYSALGIFDGRFFLGRISLKTLAGGLPLHISRAHQLCCPIFIPAGSPSHPLFPASWSKTHSPVPPLPPLTVLGHKQGFPSFPAWCHGLCSASLQLKERQQQSTAELIWAVCWKGHCCHIWELLLGQRKGSFRTWRGRRSGWHILWRVPDLHYYQASKSICKR